MYCEVFQTPFSNRVLFCVFLFVFNILLFVFVFRSVADFHVFFIVGTSEYYNYFTSWLNGFKMRYDFIERSSCAVFMYFRYFSAYAHLSVASKKLLELQKCLNKSVWRFVENHSSGFVLQRFEPALASFLLWKESLEAESFIRQLLLADTAPLCRCVHIRVQEESLGLRFQVYRHRR